MLSIGPVERMFGWLASVVLGVTARVVSLVKTADGSRGAVLGAGTRLLEAGRVRNLSKRRDNIRVGLNGRINGEVLVFRHAGRIVAGDWFYIGAGSTIWSSDPEGILIGDRVLISMNVHIHDTNSHSLDHEQRFRHTQEMMLRGHPDTNPGIRSRPIVIGDDVWIGFGASILKGVTIGQRAIIGAQSVITGDVPDDAVIPARQAHP